MAQPAVKPAEVFTYGQYRTWGDGQRWELYSGQPVLMSPAPTTRHQTVAGGLYAAIANALRGRRCRPFIAPTDVLFPAYPEQDDDDVSDVVQPDVLVVCDPAKVRHANIRGAPDLVIEVLSPATAKRDQGAKRDLYEKAGVAELWLVYADFRTIQRYSHNGLGYGKPDLFSSDDELPSTAVPDLTVPLGPVFADP